MLLGYPVGEIAWLVLWIVVAGIVVGILAGLFGIGGGAVIVPVLYEVFRALDVPEVVRMQLCIGTSLAIIVPTTVRSYIAHKKKGAVIPDVVRIWALPAVVGVAIGSVTASFAPSTVFKIAFIIFAAFIATRMLFGSDRWNLGKELPGRGHSAVFRFHHRAVFIAGRRQRRRGVERRAHALRPPMQRAVATSAGIGVPITIAGTIGYILAGRRHMAELPPLSIGFVSLIGFVLMAPVSSYTATYGVRLAHWMPRRKLEIAFGFLPAAGGAALLDQPDLARGSDRSPDERSEIRGWASAMQFAFRFAPCGLEFSGTQLRRL